MYGSTRGLKVSAGHCTGATSECTAVHGSYAAPSEPDAQHVVIFPDNFFCVVSIQYGKLPYSPALQQNFTLGHNFFLLVFVKKKNWGVCQLSLSADSQRPLSSEVSTVVSGYAYGRLP